MMLPALTFAAAAFAGGPVVAHPAAPVYAHHAVSVSDPQSQALFDRGLTLFYAYNGTEGVHVFEALEKREPKLAMAYWGEALSDGPDINTPLTQAGFDAGHAAIEKAAALLSGATEPERAYINAMRARYAGRWADRAKAERAFESAMKAAVAAYPADNDLAALYVEAKLETIGAEHLWKSGSSVPASNDTAEMVALLDAVVARAPNHVMANHLTIHIFEPSTDRTRAVASARRFDAMSFAPEDEHLAHMTAHTWIDVGDYAKSVTASRRAITLFDTYLAMPGTDPGHTEYIWHDLNVGWGAALMLHDYEQAQWFAKRLDSSASHRAPFAALTAARFGQWAQIPSTAQTPSDPLHLAIALSKVAHGDAAGANAELTAALNTKGNLGYLVYALRGCVAALEHDDATAQKQFQKALALEHDAFSGDSLPLIPTSELMGATYFQLGEYAKAEPAYRDALQSYADDRWAVSGLTEAHKKRITTPNGS
ncbi:MAG: tetratricopeptide repeat protein [Vulcanimicrobiaceae bacterium]